MIPTASETSATAAQLAEALLRGEVVPYYQPKIAIDGLRVVAVEVLARWIHPTQGHLAAADFLPLAGSAGLMGNVNDVVIQTAIKDAQTWPSVDPVGISFNVAIDYLRSADSVDRLQNLFRGSHLAPARVTIEIDAAILKQLTPALAQRLRAIKAAGMRLSLDGYGVDDLPMEMLADLPVDEIKMYRVAIAAADSSETERAKLRNTITTITGQKIEVTAIGLETATDRALASDFGFHSAQGYFIARPMANAQLQKFIAEKGALLMPSFQSEFDTATRQKAIVAAVAAAREASAAAGKGRILVVDDMATNRFLVSSSLVAAGYVVVEANDGESALKIVEQGGIDAMIMDHLMPNMTGIEVLKRLRLKHSSYALPIIIVTSIYDTDIVLDAIASGANDYITKPFESLVLQARLDAHIERKRFAENMLKAKEEADRANRAKSDFLNSMSHELRTPLNGILGMAELMEMDIEAAGHDQYTETIRLIRHSGNILLDLITDLLDLGRIEAGKMVVQLENVNLAELANVVAELARPMTSKNNNTLTVEIEAGLQVIHTDRMRLRQVLFNLVSNAGKFTENGAISINLRRSKPDSAAWVLLEVADTGIGMTPDECAVLFQQFSQANQNIWARYGGSGLGLMISKHIVELLGGELSVQSNKGQGSTFTARLPLNPPVAVH